MDGRLILLKKNKRVECRCVLTDLKEFILYEPNSKRVKTNFKLKDCQKISRYQDNSWEITYKPGKSFHFLNDTQTSNLWFETIYEAFMKSRNEELKEILSNKNAANDDNIYELIIDSELTNPIFFKKFKENTLYNIKIDENGICLQNTHERHMFDANTIRRFGSTDDCFAFELGRKSSFGNGIIALQSKKHNSKIFYDHFNELTEKSFYSLREKLLNAIEEPSELTPNRELSTEPDCSIVQQDDDSCVPTSQKIDKEMFLCHADDHTSYSGSISDSIDSFSTVEIPIIVEDRTMNNGNGNELLNESILSSECTYNADETLTFYEDKYVPEYMNNKHLISQPLEFFEDDENMIYARVKL